MPVVDSKKTKQLLLATKPNTKKDLVRIIVDVVTGNCPTGVNLVRWKVSNDDYCRECGEEEETIEHLLCHCPALEYRRFKTLGQGFLEGLEEAAEANISDIGNFAKSWKCFNAKKE